MTIIKRADLGRPLTWDELDDNFQQVDDLTAAASAAVSSAAASATAAASSATDAANSAANAVAAIVSAVKSTVTFTTGGTLNSNLDRISDGTYLYYWTGAYPVTVPAGSTVDGTGGVSVGAWACDTDLPLRQELASNAGASNVGTLAGITVEESLTNNHVNAREQWHRSLAEAGLTLVSGSFEEGATANSSTDAVWHIAAGQCYTWDGAFPKTVPANSTPTSTGGVGPSAWVSVGDASLRSELSRNDGYKFIGECPDVSTLRTIKPDFPGQLIRLKSYYSDIESGGNRLFRSSNAPGLVDNGGTIFTATGGYAWVCINTNEASLEDFGARPGVDATDAFRRAVNSSITKLSSNLSEIILTDNIVITRGDLELWLPNTVILWNAPEGHIPDRAGSSNATNYRFPGIIAFRGSVGNLIDTFVLTNQISKGDTTYWCTNNTLFTHRQWVIMSSDVGSGTIGREINVMTQVQGSGGAVTQLRVDYKTGWPLAVGRSLSYREVTPLENIKIKVKGFKWNQNITDASGSGDEFTSAQSCALVSLEYVNNADVSLGDGYDHPYPMVVTAYVRKVFVHDTTTNFPRVPGSDHVVQFNNAYQCRCENLYNISGRHIVDFSGASYCNVRNCGETGTRNGAFTTHGIFEHHLSYENCYGLLSFANSGEYYGSSADSIDVSNHFGDYLIATAKVTNLNIEHAVFTKGARVNNDANTLNDVTVGANSSDADKGLRFTQSSNVYGRGAKVIGGDVILSTQSGMAFPDALTQHVVFDSTYVRNFNSAYIGGSAVSFIDCESAGSGSSPENIVQAVRFTINGGSLTNTGFSFQGTNEQVVKVHGLSQIGTGASGLNSHFSLDKNDEGSGPITFSYKNNVAILPTGTKAYRLSNGVGPFRVHSTGNTFQGGSIEFQTTIPSGGSYLNHTGNVERGVTRVNEPTNTSAIVTTGNMIF